MKRLRQRTSVVLLMVIATVVTVLSGPLVCFSGGGGVQKTYLPCCLGFASPLSQSARTPVVIGVGSSRNRCMCAAVVAVDPTNDEARIALAPNLELSSQDAFPVTRSADPLTGSLFHFYAFPTLSLIQKTSVVFLI